MCIMYRLTHCGDQACLCLCLSFRWVCDWCPPIIRRLQKEVDKEETEEKDEELQRKLDSKTSEKVAEDDGE